MADLPERIAQAVAERTVALVVDALDVDALLARIDVDELLARTDVAAVVDRIDVDALLARIDIEELVARIDLASTVATTAGAAADDVVGAVRRTARQGDDVVAHLVDRLRRRAR